MKLKNRSMVALRVARPIPTMKEKTLAMMKNMKTPEMNTG
jgi:hypothetical protein